MSITLDQPAVGDSIRFLLRRETRAEHAALDHHPAFLALVGGGLDLATYRRLMQAMHGLYRAIDAPVTAACVDHALGRYGFAYEARAPILARDLASLGMAARQPEDARRFDLQLDTPWSLAGALYVIEGSVLGGATLSKATQQLLDRHGAAGNAYWQWCRHEGAARWAMTCRLLDALATSAKARDGLISGARAGFRLFADGLDLRSGALPEMGHSPC